MEITERKAKNKMITQSSEGRKERHLYDAVEYAEQRVIEERLSEDSISGKSITNPFYKNIKTTPCLHFHKNVSLAVTSPSRLCSERTIHC